ncbi:MAG TPA: hypothetical protein EYN33_06100 [Gammaproteobacteria bacterium]|jgi:hypothetical protein|nr:MAG: hypothetical protein CXT76_01140 [Candidatus Parvarchaeota archaeon]HIG52367.1 hypothetical protein [Candidatus Pacearchaeota archaeon]HIO43572.1 hypothetical protein [Gammaproteobacteria bacterium]
MKITMILLKILFMGALLIVSNGELALKDEENRETFLNSYSYWLSNLQEHAGFFLNYILKTEWLPDTNEKLIIPES